MIRSPKKVGALVGFAALLSQLGHLLVYQLQFGSSASAVQSTGAHAYFPMLVKTGLGLSAAVLLAGLIVIGVARLVAAGSTVEPAVGPSYISLVALMFTVQMACFGLQETVESVVVGMAVASAPHILLLGAAGQLPVAVLGALALKWLLLRLGTAIAQIRVALPTIRVPVPVIVAAVIAASQPDRDRIVRQVAGGSINRRGPPSSLRFSLH